MDLSQLRGEEKALLARLDDLLYLSETKQTTRFTPFLNERLVLIANEYQRQSHAEHFLLYGGYPGAVRQRAGFFPFWQPPEEAEFPIEAITLRLPRGAELSHRDYLGSLMALNIARESIGDILPGAGICHFFVARAVGPVILDELRKVGNTGVRCEPGLHDFVRPVPNFVEVSGTVSSLRLDCLVSLLTHRSRDKSAAMIRAELVQLNYAVCESISQQFAPGDTLVVRGYGKYIVDGIGAPTKKGRLPIACRKYA